MPSERRADEPGAGRTPDAPASRKKRGGSKDRTVAVTETAFGRVAIGGRLNRPYLRVPAPSAEEIREAIANANAMAYPATPEEIERMDAIRRRVATRMFEERYEKKG